MNEKEQIAGTIRAYYFHDDKDIVRSMRTAEAILYLRDICPECGGGGLVDYLQRHDEGDGTCPTCKGRLGEKMLGICKDCKYKQEVNRPHNVYGTSRSL